jgi:hypothetical protein
MLAMRALLTAAGVAALIVTAAPPALAEPAQDQPYSQLVPLADLDPNFERRGGEVERSGIDVTADGTVYVTQQGKQRLYVVGPDGKVGTAPGTWVEPDRDPDSYGASAVAVEVAGDGTVYVITDGSLNRLTPNGTDSTVAGGGAASFYGDAKGGDGGPATGVSLFDLQDLALDAVGNRYLADRHNDRIRRIAPNGVITTIAGGGLDDADGVPATKAALYRPRAVEVDPAGNVYVLEERGGISKIGPDGTISAVIGQQGPGFSGDGGPAAKGQLGGRGEHSWEGGGGLDTDAEGNLYFADTGNGFVRRIDTKGILSTLGPLVGTDIAVGPNGDVYQVAVDEVLVLRKETRVDSKRVTAGPAPRWTNRAPGTVLRVAGTGRSPASGVGGTFDTGAWVAAGPDGTAYVSDPLAHQVYRVTADGRREPFAGTGERGRFGDDGPATRARLNHPTGVAVGPDGTVYIADHGNQRVRKVGPDGTISTHAKANAMDLAVDGAGVLYVATSDDGILEIDGAGKRTTVAGGGESGVESAVGGPATACKLFPHPSIAVDGTGVLYFADFGEGAIYRVALDGTLSVLAARGSGAFDPKGEASTIASADDADVAVGPDGTLYFTDREDNQVRALLPAGTARVVAEVPAPTHLAVAADGTRLITGTDRDALHRVAPDGARRTDTGLTAGHEDRDAGPAAERPIDSVHSIRVQPSGALTVEMISGVLQLDGDGTLEPFRDFRTPDDFSGVAGAPLAFGPDGSVYVRTKTGIERRFADGTRQPLVGAPVPEAGRVAGRVRTGVAAVTQRLKVSGAAVTSRGDLYLTVGRTLYRLGEDGTLTEATTFRGDAGALTAGPDGTLYAIVGDQVHRVDARHQVTTVAGGGSFEESQENGDGGPATEAELSGPRTLAVSRNGYLYIGTDAEGIRRVAPDGTIGTLQTPRGRYGSHDGVDALAVDRHGTVYYAAGRQQVTAVVRADAAELPTDNPFPWSAVLGGTGALVVLGAAGWWFLRRRAAKTADHNGTVHSGEKADPAAESATEPDQEPS